MIKRICPNCGEIVESKFCTSCGQDLTGPEVVKICPKCGTQTASKFCTSCGESLLEASGNTENPPVIEAEPIVSEDSVESLSASALYQKVKKIGTDKMKDLEHDAEIRRAQKAREEEIRRLEQEKELEVRRLEKEKELNERRIAQEKETERLRIMKEKEAERLKQDAEEKAELEKKAKLLETKRIYEEATAYLENANKSTDSAIAANFFRKAQSMFTSIAGWEDADEKSLYAARKAKEHEIVVEEEKIKEQEKIEKQKQEQVAQEKLENDHQTYAATVPVERDEVEQPHEITAQRNPSEESNNDGKKGGSKRILIIVVAAIVVIGMIAAFALTGSDNDDASQSQNTESTTSGNDEYTSEEVSADFEDANIFAFEQVKRDDESYEEVINTTKVVNNGKEPIMYFDVTAAFYDKDGNEISNDSRYCECTLKKGCSATVQHYSDLSGRPKGDVDKIEITSYSYRIGDVQYDVDLQAKTVSAYTGSTYSNAEFDKVNILSFESEDKGVVDGYYEVAVTIKNNGKEMVDEPSYQQAYYDAKGNYLGDDGRSNDTGIQPGKSAVLESYLSAEDIDGEVASHEITSYSYTLAENDENGFNHYDINILEKTAYGSQY